MQCLYKLSVIEVAVLKKSLNFVSVLRYLYISQPSCSILRVLYFHSSTTPTETPTTTTTTTTTIMVCPHREFVYITVGVIVCNKTCVSTGLSLKSCDGRHEGLCIVSSGTLI